MEEYRELVEDINCHYDFHITDIHLLKLSENSTFTMIDENKNKYILRINRPNYHSYDELDGETRWMSAIKSQTDLQLPSVYTNLNGNYVTEFACQNSFGTLYSVFSYISGHDLQSNSFEELCNNLLNVGKTAAKLHNQVINDSSLNALKRFQWGYEELIGSNPRWGQWRAHPLLSPDQIDIFTKASDAIKTRLGSYGTSSNRYGLIHADLHLSNFLQSQDKLYLIDFDDCGYGWFLYECGCSLMQYNEHLDILCKYWLKGYTEERFLSSEDLDMIWTFILLRRIVRIGWMSSHSSSDTATGLNNFSTYINVTEELARKYLTHKLPEFH